MKMDIQNLLDKDIYSVIMTEHGKDVNFIGYLFEKDKGEYYFARFRDAEYTAGFDSLEVFAEWLDEALPEYEEKIDNIEEYLSENFKDVKALPLSKVDAFTPRGLYINANSIN